jgi:Protein of unknown function (DUF2975)
MLALTANRLVAIQRASRSLRIFFIFLAAVLAFGTLNKFTQPFPPGSRTLAGVVFQGTAITGKIQILWLVRTALYALLNLKILYHFIRLLGMFAQGKLFTAQSVAQLRQIGLTLVSTLVVWLVALIGAWPEIVAAQDQWVKIVPSFPGGAALTGGVFLFAAQIMNESRELREEQDLVV